MENKNQKPDVHAIVGLGNIGPRFEGTRHNIGFALLEQIAEQENASEWQQKDLLDHAEVALEDKKIVLVKPRTFMNLSGKVIPFLNRQGIKADHILVIHDELELPFGKTKIRFGGSARGHNGLRSIIEQTGKDFYRFSFGIDRPENKSEVGSYVLQKFSENQDDLDQAIIAAVLKIRELL